MGQRTWGIDVSDWNDPNAIDYDYLFENGCRFVIIKASMGGGLSRKLEAHARKARESNLHVLIYHWADPTASIGAQLDYIEQAVEKVKPEGIAIDIEQWWANWSEYHEYLLGKRKINEVRVLSPYFLNSFYFRFMIEVSLRFPKIRRNNILYSARWFWTKYVPDMESWMKRYPLWLALYPWKSMRLASWSDFGKTILNARWSLNLPWDLWQVADNKVILPKMRVGVDIDLFNGDYNQFVEWLETDHYIEEEARIFIDTVVVTARLGLIIRDAPNGRDTGKRLKYLDRVKIFDRQPAGKHIWGKIGEGEWVALTYTKPVEV